MNDTERRSPATLPCLLAGATFVLAVFCGIWAILLCAEVLQAAVPIVSAWPEAWPH